MLLTRCTSVGKRSVACFAAAIALLTVSLPAAAAQVFHSPADDGTPGSHIPEGGSQSVYLWIDGGAGATQSGTPCHTGDGDELCGFEFVLDGLGGLTFASFTPDAGADVMVNLSTGQVALNGLDTTSPAPGPKRLGELVVTSVAGGEIELSTGAVVHADLSLESLPTATVVSVPEPAAWLAIASGVGLLRMLGRRRMAREVA